MGCDIHVTIEYDHPELGFQPFVVGGVFIPRDYRLFGALAGVRLREGESSMIEPRGIPEDACDLIRNQFCQIVTPDKRLEYFDMGYNVIRESQIGDRQAEARPCELLGTANWLQDADFHSISYLSLAEINQCLAFRDIQHDQLSAEFLCLTDSLQSLNLRFSDSVSRLVFGFDN